MYDLAIIITTVCRKSLLRAVESIYQQDFTGTIQILIGVDKDLTGEEANLYRHLKEKCPLNYSLFWFNPGYSTSKRHGGIHTCYFGGSMRTILSFLANAEKIIYLDDDDWLTPEHCRLLHKASLDKPWAFSRCIYADSDKSIGICIDELESVGVNKGIYTNNFGGFVRPSALLLDKTKVPHLLHLWSISPNKNGDAEDRLIFNELRHLPHGDTYTPTVFYSLDPNDTMHQTRLEYIRSQGKTFEAIDKIGTVRK